MKLTINKRYSLVPLTKIDKEDIRPVFKNGVGVYICNFPEQKWYDFHNFERKRNYGIEKKERFFQLMNEGSMLLSPTQDSLIMKPTKSFNNGKIYHFGSIFKGRYAQISQAIKIIFFLVKKRNFFNYCLVYNFYPGEMTIAFFAKYFLKKKIIVDFEDDYLKQTKKHFYQYYFNFVKKIPDSIICINRNMVHYFQNQEIYVFNGFIEIDYVDKIDFELKENIRFLFSGTLDDIRGADLIPDIILALRKEISSFKIFITGSGPYEEEVKKWKFPEVEFLGFLSSKDYNKALQAADAYLVLQKPDHPFNLGSFPSKIEFYAKFKKPIYRIELNQ